jgi:hypothetical protein
MTVRHRVAAAALAGLVAFVGLGASPVDAIAAPATREAPAAPAATDEQLRAYIESVYQLLLGRGADDVGMQYWLGKFHEGVARETIASAFANSGEFRSGILAAHYQYFLFRPIDSAGLDYFLALMRFAGFRIQDIDVLLMASDEYYDFADRIPSEYIRLVYHHLLGREPDSGGMSYWLGQLGPNPGPSQRGLVAAAIIYSTEALTPVVGFYYQYVLGRPGDPAGVAYWVGQIQAGHRDEDVIALLIGSDEYFDLVT